MTAANRGTKRRCPNCGAAYYDLDRTPILCPKCQALYVETPRVPARPPRGRAGIPAPAAAPEDEEKIFDEDEVIDHEVLEEETLPEDETEEMEPDDRE